MSEIEKMNRYVQKTAIPKKVLNCYGIRFSEMRALTEKAGPFDIVCMAFRYGMAKGYRAALASTKKGAKA